jgi:Flp pilus assembly protein TadG
LLLGLVFVGVAIDGARLFTARRDLQNVADSAALAGASAVDERAFRDSEGAEVRVDPLAARQAIDEVVRASSLPSSTHVDVQVASDRVVVRIARPVRMQFLGLLGLAPQQIGAHASAAPQTG